MRNLLVVIGTALAVATAGAAAAQDTTAPSNNTAIGSTHTHISNGPVVQKSLPSSAPAATTTRTTGANDQDKTVKTMNNNEKAKIEVGGK